MKYRDRTWCASPNCKNECRRKLTPIDKKIMADSPVNWLVSYAYFCGEPESKNNVKVDE